MAELGGHAVQEQPQRFVTALLAAGFPFVGVALATGDDVGGTVPLAGAVEVAGFGRVETWVAGSLGVGTVETFGDHGEHP